MFIFPNNYPGKVTDRNFELFWFIPIDVSEPMRTIPNQSEEGSVSRLM